MSIGQFQEQIYAGVLGKIIGVYMGRPVEGWSYDAIKSRFDFIDYYVAHKTGAPFIVPDDDISGTFNFYRALEDNQYTSEITAEQIGEAWLNYIIEDKTILWWGGLARSTEHSAYLRLKSGVKPPVSGSGEMNGMAIAEQIGAQIFIDTWALVNPGNPKRAAEMARKASIVSHDGIAVECAVYLAALEALAFTVKDVDQLLELGREYIGDNKYGHQLKKLLDDLLLQCSKTDNWRNVRDWIEENHNYAKYQGNCPMIPNHLSVIMALKFAGDSFHRSIGIASSAGWDTDCNSGNVGCLNAIRLGLKSLDQDAELRRPVADRMYVVSTDGGDCIYDAVRETRKIMRAAAALNEEIYQAPDKRYAFEMPGSVQGFLIHPTHPMDQAVISLENTLEDSGTAGLEMKYKGLSGSVTGTVSVQTYVDPTPKAAPDTSYFEVYASPSLYSGQCVETEIFCPDKIMPKVRFFIDYYDETDDISTMKSDLSQLENGENRLTWTIPDTRGRAIYRFGIELVSDKRMDGKVILRSVDWKDAPAYFHMGTAQELTPGISPFVIRTKWMMAFMNSTKHTGPDYLATFAISHPEKNGVMTIGTNDWSDYAVESYIQFVHANYAGLVARSKGHRQYYAAVMENGKYRIICRKADYIKVLAESDITYSEGDWHNLRFEASGNHLILQVDGQIVCKSSDDTYSKGSCGFVVEEGAIVAKGFTVEAVKK